MKIITSLGLFILVAGVIFGNQAFAESLDNVQTSISNYEDNSATIQVTWNYDVKTTNYEVGCVSCSPNTAEFTTDDNITLHNVTPFPNNSFVMLYVISYNSQNDIIFAKQLIIDLNQTQN